MADKVEDREENQGIKGRLRGAFSEDGIMPEIGEGFVRGSLMLNDDDDSRLFYPIATVLTLSFITFVGASDSDFDHTNVNIDPSLMSMMNGQNAPLSYMAVDASNDDKVNPLVLVREGDTYRIYKQDEKSLHQELVYEVNQLEAWRLASQMVEDLKALKEQLQNTGENTPDFLPQFIEYAKISGLYFEDDLVTRDAQMRAEGANDRTPMNINALLDQAIEQWSAAADAAKNGSYGFTAADYMTVEGPLSGLTDQANQSAQGDNPLRIGLPNLPEGEGKINDDLAGWLLKKGLLGTLFLSLGVGALNGSIYGLSHTMRRRRERKNKQRHNSRN